MEENSPEMEKLGSIDTSSLVDKAEQRIIQYIQKNKLTVGDVLPKELDLADNLGVSIEIENHWID